jgi:hypothetical protein
VGTDSQALVVVLHLLTVTSFSSLFLA